MAGQTRGGLAASLGGGLGESLPALSGTGCFTPTVLNSSPMTTSVYPVVNTARHTWSVKRPAAHKKL